LLEPVRRFERRVLPMAVAGGLLWLSAFVIVPHLAVNGLSLIQGVDGREGTFLSPPAARVGTLTLTALGMIAFSISLGFAITKSADGIFLSSRNVYSLSRFQMVLWTVLILSAVMSAAAWRAWQPGGGGDVLAIVIHSELLQVMGISYVSAAATPALLSLKTQTATAGELASASSRLGETVHAKGQLVTRPPGATASITDLVQGDELANAGTIDLSKVQQLIITLLLVTVYAGMVFKLFLSPAPFLGAQTELPELSQGLVNLLLISHGGYLAYKAASKPGPADGDTQGPPPPPDRNSGLA
jgi:hypothetical protein